MAYNITTNTRFAGSTRGTFLNDLTSPSVGQSTVNPAGKEITKIAVVGSAIIDSVKITYKVENSPNPITVVHGGPGGLAVPLVSFDLTANEKLVAVYGNRLVSPSPYGGKHFIQLSFIVVNNSGNTPTSKVYTATSGYSAPTEKVELSFPLITASSYTFQPQGQPVGYLEGIGFSNVSFQADSSA